MYASKLGFQIGFTQTFGSFLQLEPGVFFIVKGAKIIFYDCDFDCSVTSKKTIYDNLTHLQIPINLKINFEVENWRFIMGLGVYGGVSTVMSKPRNPYKNVFDFGGQIFGGIQYGRLGVNLGYQPGFTSVFRKEEIYNSSFIFGLSYAIMGYTKANKTTNNN